MANYSWTNPVSGDWNTGTLWTPSTVPNDVTADVTIDATTTVANGYAVTIAAGESFAVDSLTMNDVGGGANTPDYEAAALELDGTLAFGPSSLGAIDGSLQTYIYTPAGNNAEIINAGTLNGFIQVGGNLLITGTNGVYITNDLQALGGTAIIDTQSIAEMTGNTLFDGIFEAKTNTPLAPALIELGGSLQGDIVSIGTVEGPSPTNVPGGWTELSFTGLSTAIEEWNGTGYVGVETSLTDIKGGGTVDVTDHNYVTSGTLTIEAQGTYSASGLLNLQGGTVTTGGLNINGGIVQGSGTIIGGVFNNGTLDALSGTLASTLDLTGSLTGTGTVLFDTVENQGPPTINSTSATLEVHAVSAGQTFVMNGDDTLRIDALTNFAGTIAAKGGDKLLLEGVTATSASLTGGILTLKNSGTTVGTIALTGTFSPNAFTTTAVDGGTEVDLGSAPPLPSITAGGTLAYAAGSAALALDAGLTVTDSGSPTLTGATVTIGTGLLAGDKLNFANQNGITGNYNAVTGLLTLSGSATVAQYQTALDSVTYNFSPGDPTHGGTDTTRAITWTINDGTTTATATSTVAVAFNSIPKLDLLFQNTDGSLALWQTDGQGVNAYGTSLPSPGSLWSLVGTGGFFTGDTGDYVFQNQDGNVALWQVNGEHLTQGTVIANPSAAFQVRGTGDFFGDGKNDTILLQGQDGSIALWQTNGGTITTAGFAKFNGSQANPGPAWQIKGAADFSGDGNSDIVLQNQDGSVAIWNMTGTTVASAGVVMSGTAVANPGPTWRVAGTGDFYDDGKSDLLLQNQDGSVAIWEIGNGETITQSGLVQFNGTTAQPGPTQHIVGTGDFNNDGHTDIVFRDDTGAISTWEMTGTTIASAHAVANPGLTWNSAGTGAMQFMYSAAAGETLTASAQVPDEFVFKNFAEGAHTVAGFNASQDIIELSAARFGTFAAVQNATTASGSGAMIHLDNNSSLLLSGVDRTTLHASNFALT